MKKLLMVAVASLAMVSAPAFAQGNSGNVGNPGGAGNSGNTNNNAGGNGNGGGGSGSTSWAGLTYGQDAQGWYSLNADVETFCKFGTNNTGGTGQNSTVTAGPSAQGGSASEGDGHFEFDLQNLNDNTVNAASGTYNMGHAVCNTPFTIQGSSAQGGLRSSTTTSDTDFVQLIPYNAAINFDGVAGNHTFQSGSAENSPQLPGTEARAGAVALTLSVQAMGQLMLQGSYTDQLTVTMSPNI